MANREISILKDRKLETVTLEKWSHNDFELANKGYRVCLPNPSKKDLLDTKEGDGKEIALRWAIQYSCEKNLDNLLDLDLWTDEKGLMHFEKDGWNIIKRLLFSNVQTVEAPLPLQFGGVTNLASLPSPSKL